MADGPEEMNEPTKKIYHGKDDEDIVSNLIQDHIEDLSSPVHLACVRFMEACAEDFDLEGNEEQMSIVVQSWASGAAAILMLQQRGDFKVEFDNEPQDADDNVDDGGGE